VAIQTSPEALLTDQVPPSAANALDVLPSTSAAITARRIPSLPSMMILSLREAAPENYRRCFNIELPDPPPDRRSA
jgi:hypothetical protein